MDCYGHKCIQVDPKLHEEKGGHPGEIKHQTRYSEAIHSTSSYSNASFPSNELRALGTICTYSCCETSLNKQELVKVEK